MKKKRQTEAVELTVVQKKGGGAVIRRDISKSHYRKPKRSLRTNHHLTCRWQGCSTEARPSTPCGDLDTRDAE